MNEREKGAIFKTVFGGQIWISLNKFGRIQSVETVGNVGAPTVIKSEQTQALVSESFEVVLKRLNLDAEPGNAQ